MGSLLILKKGVAETTDLKDVTITAAELNALADQGFSEGDGATLAAAGTNQATAAVIAAVFSYVTGADGTKGVVLPTAAEGLVRGVYNTDATNDLKVYPATSDDINDGTVNVHVLVPPKTFAIFRALDATTWMHADYVSIRGAQTVTGVKTMSGANVITHAPTGLKVQDSDASHAVTIAFGNESADRTLSVPVLGAAATILIAELAQLIAGAKTFTAGAAAAAVALRLGASATEGAEIRVIDEDVVIGSALASVDLTEDIPSGAVILSVQANNETTITGTTAVKVGVGVAADPDKYGKTGDFVQNTKVDTVPDWAVLSGAEDIKIFAVDTAGAAAGTIDSGTVRVRIAYLALNSLDNAA